MHTHVHRYVTFHRIILGMILSNFFLILAFYLKNPSSMTIIILLPLPMACYFFEVSVCLQINPPV